MSDHLDQLLQKTLRETFGLQQFRTGQLEAITTLMEQGCCLCIQPTGHGKSLLYQLPAVLLDGITVVISPLLALMRDQIMQLNNRFNISAASLNTDQTDEENLQAQNDAQQGKIKILFIAPEKLDHLHYFEFLCRLPIRLIVIDEAHCISVWGHDFRPSYRQIIRFVNAIEQRFAEIKILAITATANQRTEEDIRQQLTQSQQAIATLRYSMNRSNIDLSVIPAADMASKLSAIASLLPQLPGNGLIYCATRENTELVAEFLQNNGVSCAAYHAGLDAEKKRHLQEELLSNRYKVFTATNALGMGIDKSDIRFIIHFDTPSSITAYYQEVGRAGRDGNLAHGILLFDAADKKIQQYFIDSALPTRDDFNGLLTCIKDTPEPPHLLEIKKLTGLHPTRITVIIAELLEQNFIVKKLLQKKQVYCVAERTGEPDLSRYENQYQTKTQDLHNMLHYAQNRKSCLMKILREALGDHDAENCQRCSVCQPLKFSINYSEEKVIPIKRWLDSRVTTIDMNKRLSLAEGVAILNGPLRSSIFVNFMKTRTLDAPLDEKLLHLIEENLKKLAHPFTTVIAVPSQTWHNRDHYGKFISDQLQAEYLPDYLSWQQLPAARQGELLNNDQRRFNVQNHMQVNSDKKINGDILLFDDYIGSGATIQEAARVLRYSARIRSTIVPFTLASVRWRLGKKGMV